MKITKFAPILLAALCGCSHPPAPVPVAAPKPVVAPKPVPPPPQRTFSIGKPKVDDYLSFIVVITRPLSQGRTLRITAESEPWLSLGNRDFRDELIQADRKEIVFDCDAIADKIIDTNLVREITPLCAEGHALGNHYWDERHGRPDEFTDDEGTTWRQVKK